MNGQRVVKDLPCEKEADTNMLGLIPHSVVVAVTDGRLVIKGAQIDREERIVREYTGRQPFVDPQIFMCGAKVTDAARKVVRLCAGHKDITDAEGNVWKAGLYRPCDVLAPLIRLASEQGKRLVVVPESNRAFEPLLGLLPGLQNVRLAARADFPWMGGWFFTRPHEAAGERGEARP